MKQEIDKPDLKILLAAPRGFCAGVDRAIQIVDRALEKFGAPVYVRHEIVHNKFVVEGLRQKGAVFVEELDEIPDDGRPVIFSAHGVPKSVPEAAVAREMMYVDATCPLVSKVHREAERHYKNGKQIILIGHKGHPEVAGTMGQLPDGAVVLVETLADVEALRFHPDPALDAGEGSLANKPKGSSVATLSQNDSNILEDPDNLAWCSQTTLSVDDTAEIVAALKAKFPAIEGPHKEDICYATTNRQEAVKAIAPKADALMVIGAPNSSNSNRLVEVGEAHGCARAILVQRAADIDWQWLQGVGVLGLTAGASAPEVLVDEVIEAAKAHFNVTVEEIRIKDENVVFKIPKALSA